MKNSKKFSKELGENDNGQFFSKFFRRGNDKGGNDRRYYGSIFIYKFNFMLKHISLKFKN